MLAIDMTTPMLASSHFSFSQKTNCEIRPERVPDVNQKEIRRIERTIRSCQSTGLMIAAHD
jgi:hypothetical protein